MLNAKKKFGIGLTLAGMALLLLAFLSIPFAWEMRIRWLLLGGGILLPWWRPASCGRRASTTCARLASPRAATSM